MREIPNAKNYQIARSEASRAIKKPLAESTEVFVRMARDYFLRQPVQLDVGRHADDGDDDATMTT